MTQENEGPSPGHDNAARNTDRHLWPDTIPEGQPHETIHVTAQGGIGINVGGYVIVKPLAEWHRLAKFAPVRPSAWYLGHLTPGTYHEPAEYNVDCVWGDDPPEGKNWKPLYVDPPSPSPLTPTGESELRDIEATLARRPALADFKTNREKITHAIATAAKADAATARADKAEAERDEANTRIERLIDRLNAECAAHDRTEAALAAMREGLEEIAWRCAEAAHPGAPVVLTERECDLLNQIAGRARSLLSPTAGEGGGERIRCGDHVLHEPSGEEWVVAWADYKSGDIAWCGWPNGIARLADCRVIKKATDEEYARYVRDVIEIGDSRSDKARRLYGTPSVPEGR